MDLRRLRVRETKNKALEQPRQEVRSRSLRSDTAGSRKKSGSQKEVVALVPGFLLLVKGRRKEDLDPKSF